MAKRTRHDQPALFPLVDDARPAAEKSAAERYLEPGLFCGDRPSKPGEEIVIGAIVAPAYRPDDAYTVHNIHEFRGELWAWGSKRINGQGIGLDLPFSQLILLSREG